jgi:phosphopantothenoylcysteine decarboxylase/phosphopantothenate--cysteine ligase
VTLAGRHVVLGVSGGIACYKSCTLARRLTELGAAVDVVMTAAATEFVRPLTFEALTKRPVLTSLWERSRALAHIELARTPDLVILAPATANLLARAAQGMADDFLTAILLATRAPVLAAPGMNDEMFAHAATSANVETLRQRGWMILGPAVGPLAEGPSDRPGRMVEPDTILAHAERILRGANSALRGRRVVVTAGPTREHLDVVRVITNPSSGRMGYAVAARAFARGAEVTLIAGPTALTAPAGVECERVETTADLQAALERALPTADVLVMAAAPSDYRPLEPATGKRPRSEGTIDVALTPTPDVLAGTASRRKAGIVTVGFALEVGEGLGRAREKLTGKQLDLVVMNRADELGSGFEVDTNRVTLVTADSESELPLLPKAEVADAILDAVEERL